MLIKLGFMTKIRSAQFADMRVFFNVDTTFSLGSMDSCTGLIDESFVTVATSKSLFSMLRMS